MDSRAGGALENDPRVQDDLKENPVHLMVVRKLQFLLLHGRLGAGRQNQ